MTEPSPFRHPPKRETIDLVYAYSQYEFQRTAAPSRIELYRGINRLAEHETLTGSKKRQIVLFNNMVSFTTSRERASEFGDYILTALVPTPKVFFSCGLLPGVVKGEDEFLVIGGVYDIAIDTH